MTELTRWAARHRGINRIVDEYIEVVRKGPSHPLQQTIQDLLTQLRVFGQGQFDFFWEESMQSFEKHFVSLSPNVGFLPSSNIDYPIPDFIFWLINNRISNDALIIHGIFEQRLIAKESNLGLFDKVDRAAHSVHDSLSSVFSVRNPIGGNIQFISYFRQSVNVRTIPYAPVALLGIPLSINDLGIGSYRDLPSIAHEVAHFYYWYGETRNNGKLPIARTLEVWADDEVPRIRHWIEEIFADVICVLIAGPVAAYSIQEIEQISVGASFKNDSGTHPTSSIRPFIHVRALKGIGAKLGRADLVEIGNTLESRWRAIRSQRGAGDSLAFDAHPPELFDNRALRSSDPYNVSDFQTHIDAAVDKILELVGPDWLNGQFIGGSPKAWTTNKDDPWKTNLDEPYAEIREWWDAFSGETLPVFTSPADLSDLWETLVNDLLKTRDIINVNSDAGEVLRHENLSGTLPPEVWVEILRFAGWTTEGPHWRN